MIQWLMDFVVQRILIIIVALLVIGMALVACQWQPSVQPKPLSVVESSQECGNAAATVVVLTYTDDPRLVADRKEDFVDWLNATGRLN